MAVHVWNNYARCVSGVRGVISAPVLLCCCAVAPPQYDKSDWKLITCVGWGGLPAGGQQARPGSGGDHSVLHSGKLGGVTLVFGPQPLHLLETDLSLTFLYTIIWLVTFDSSKKPQRLWPFGAHKALATTSHITPQTTNKQSFHVHHLALPVININIMASSASLLSYFMQNLFLNHVNIEERTIC